MHVLDILQQRGFVQQCSDEAALRRGLERPVTLYCGYDPTRDSLQVGNLVSVMMLAHFQREGHRPIVLLGGGTGLIGDPSGKTEMRQMLTNDQLEANADALRGQFGRFLRFGDQQAVMLNNADWLLELGYIQFLRDIGRHFSVNQLLQHETYRERLGADGLNFIELNYALLQAYDFLHLKREFDCILQVGGNDQWFNILSGVDLVRRVEGVQVHALVSPLITTASGAKMGKTEAGAVWLDPGVTSPFAFYQYWINVEDPDVERFLKLFTFLPVEEIEQLVAPGGAELRLAKEVLAYEVTRLVHGEEAAQRARSAARSLFGGSGEGFEDVPTTMIDSWQLEDGLELVDALVRAGLAASKTVAKEQIRGGGVYVNNARVTNTDQRIRRQDLVDGQILLRRGKKQYRRLVVR
jgi:tyrosyl-tRNA synthetase